MVDAKARALGLDTVFAGVAIGYVFLFLALVWLVVVVAKSNRARAIGTAIVFLVFGALPFWIFVYETPVEKEYRARQVAQQNEWKAKYEAAKPIFDKLCAEQSQPIIRRTVEDVDGILLLRVRPARWNPSVVHPKVSDWPEAAIPGFGRAREERGSHGYAESFLMDWRWGDVKASQGNQPFRAWESWTGIRPPMRRPLEQPWQGGFQYVDVLKSDGHSRIRYVATLDETHTLRPFEGRAISETTALQPAPPFGITFEDNLDPALRKHWIAGVTLQIIDMANSDVIASQSFWSWERGFGALGEGQPWSTNIETCLPRTNASHAMGFIYSMLKPRQGNTNDHK